MTSCRSSSPASFRRTPLRLLSSYSEGTNAALQQALADDLNHIVNRRADL